MAAWAIALVIIVGSLFLVLLFCVSISCLVIVCTRKHRRERTIVCPDIRGNLGLVYIQEPAVPSTQTQIRWADQGMAAGAGGPFVGASDNTYLQPQPPGSLATIAPPIYSATTLKMEKSGEDLEPPRYEDLSPREAPQLENDPAVANRITSEVDRNII